MATYRKEMSLNTILSARSCHPSHTVRAILVFELTHAKRNCATTDAFLAEQSAVCQRLKIRNYPEWMLRRAEQKVSCVSRDALLKDKYVNKAIDHQTFTVFSTSYSKNYNNICGIINTHLPILKADPAVRKVLADGFKCVAKRAPTLGNSLCPSLVQSANQHKLTWLTHTGCYKCSHSICTCCKYVTISQNFTTLNTVLNYKIKQFINCNTTHVVKKKVIGFVRWNSFYWKYPKVTGVITIGFCEMMAITYILYIISNLYRQNHRQMLQSPKT